jgi:hypothetical protein
MAENNPRRGRGQNRPPSARKGKPEGRSGFVSATAAVGAVAVGAFLWSRRDQISDQAGRVADRLSRRREGVQLDDDASGLGTSGGDSRTQAEIAAEALTLKELGKTA